MGDELDFDFDADTYVPVLNEFSLLPIGDVTAMIVKSDYGATAAGNGKVIKLVLDILDGPSKGRKIFSNLCVKHTNPKTENIANAHFQELLKACGVPRTNRKLSPLHNIPITVRVALGKDSRTGKDQNEYTFKPLGGGAPAAPRPQYTPQTQTEAPPPNVMPSAAPTVRAWQK